MKSDQKFGQKHRFGEGQISLRHTIFMPLVKFLICRVWILALFCTMLHNHNTLAKPPVCKAAVSLNTVRWKQDDGVVG
jgi:hypothetical protein